jgi:hypothetical protein
MYHFTHLNGLVWPISAGKVTAFFYSANRVPGYSGLILFFLFSLPGMIFYTTTLM